MVGALASVLYWSAVAVGGFWGWLAAMAAGAMALRRLGRRRDALRRKCEGVRFCN